MARGSGNNSNGAFIGGASRGYPISPSPAADMRGLSVSDEYRQAAEAVKLDMDLNPLRRVFKVRIRADKKYSIKPLENIRKEVVIVSLPFDRTRTAQSSQLCVRASNEKIAEERVSRLLAGLQVEYELLPGTENYNNIGLIGATD